MLHPFEVKPSCLFTFANRLRASTALMCIQRHRCCTVCRRSSSCHGFGKGKAQPRSLQTSLTRARRRSNTNRYTAPLRPSSIILCHLRYFFTPQSLPLFTSLEQGCRGRRWPSTGTNFARLSETTQSRNSHSMRSANISKNDPKIHTCW